ncbi:MAG: hypothetical protein IT370_17310 [Deltaproteobacteria bacterium]|nr:hypothetical protein [Deltaproteobacteria bacterium]
MRFTLGACLAVVLAVSAACTVEVDYGATRFRCPDGTCPSGQVCIANLCQPTLSPLDAAVASDGAGAGDGATSDASPADASLDAALPNLLPNPGIEGNINPWTAFAGSPRFTTTSPHSGAGALVGCKDATGMPDLFTVYVDPIATAPTLMGTRYQGSVWVRKSFAAAEEAPPTLQLVLRERGGTQPLRDHLGPAVGPITTTWVQLTVDATITDAGRTGLNFIIWPGDVADGVCFAVDDGNLWRLE